ncbi:MAG: LPS export ABC transporter permease LptF [Desulfarculaceae bacterium]|nr:LPS export ABC transporter permease LptF [Desulfarculaceae bacterium]MCF8073946.1 LPS export ABC transporter permease LptF [Desulfarculaceae bacterium]MCF8102632.1 LPS export ABC transporter permease LptF [Desulfarculaceae bacterium]MCF8117599.1 LPS export ABC transporter permease LptF [Desulfarculaceae bacterium]
MFKARIIHRYLFFEMLSPYFVSLGVFTFVLLMAKIMELTDLVVSRGVGLSVVGRLLLYTMPYFLVFTIPMATLLGVLIAFLRLSSDNEIVAIKAAGISLSRLLPPVAALALFSWATTSALAFWALPWGNNSFENLVYKVASSQAELALKESSFIDTFPNLVIYINKLPGGGVLKDVFIVDQRDPEKQHTIVAKRGKFFPGQGGKLTLRLYEGGIHAVSPDKRSAETAGFDTYDVTLDAGAFVAKQRKDKHEKEMYVSELLAELKKAPPDSKRYYLVDMELQKKFSLPFACLVMALIGLPLGIHSRSGRSWGVAVALVVFLSYYLLLSAAWSLGESGFYPPMVGMWVPNIVFGLLGALMFRQELKETPIPLLNKLERLPALLARLRALRPGAAPEA